MPDPIVIAEQEFKIDTKRFLKSGDCCSYIEYSSYYEESFLIPNQPYITTLELVKEDCCGRRTCLDIRNDIPGSTTQLFTNLLGDGKYVLIVSFYDEIEEETYIVELCIQLSCCDDKRTSLASEIACKMATISCKICKYSSVGRNITKLKKNYLKLSNFLYLLRSCSCAGKIPLTCKEVESIKCKFKKIK